MCAIVKYRNEATINILKQKPVFCKLHSLSTHYKVTPSKDAVLKDIVFILIIASYYSFRELSYTIIFSETYK